MLTIYFSRIFEYKVNRIVNIIAAIFTIIYVIGGGDTATHYFIIATIEIIFLIMIIVYSVKWKNEMKE